MNYLRIDEVFAIHATMIAAGGGRGEIHDFTLLHSAVERPKATFGGKELYSGVWIKAAALLHSLVKNHPFDDGNKRTAYYSARRFLYINGHRVFAPKKEAVSFMVSVDTKNLTLRQITTWLRAHETHD